MSETSFGRYRLIAELGQGGMADVFLAVQAGPAGSGFRKLTVIKRLRQNLAEEPEFVSMLVDEARIAARLNHPNVVQTNEVGQVGEQYFIAMEYLDGQPLHRIQFRSAQRATKENAPQLVSPSQQYIVVMDTLAGLHHAHELLDYDGTPLEIVHRDMSPHNVFVTYTGQVKVVDFGIAKAVGRAAETRQGVVKGKVRYMAPEQAIGQGVDRRADIFAVGIILWEMTTGRRFWKDVDELQIVHALLNGSFPASPRSVDPTIPEGIDRICAKALARNKEDRYATAEDFRTDLEQYLAESGQLVEARRALPRSCDELFKDKRLEIKRVIERQLASLEDGMPTSQFQAVTIAPAGSNSAPMSISLPANPSLVPEESGTSLTHQKNIATASTQSAGPRTRGTRFAAAAGAAALAVALVVAGWRLVGPGRPGTSAALPTAGEISMHLSVSPANARVTIDGAPPRTAPVDAKLPRDDHEHTIRIEADGFQPKVDTVKFTSDIMMSVELRPAVTAETSATAGKGHAVATPPRPTTGYVPVTRNNPTPTAAAAPPPETAVAPPPPPPPTASETGKHPKPLDKADPWQIK